MHLHQIDLNLFVVFNAIFQQASITRAAQALGLTQPAVSHTLSKLRELYQDPLFVRRGLFMEPTPMARRMFPSIREALDRLDGTLPTQPAAFDPIASRQNFVLAIRDQLEALFIPQLMQILAEESPHSQLTSVRIKRPHMEKELASGQLDLAFDVLLPVSSQLRSHKLMEDQWVVTGRRGHPLLQKHLDTGAYLSAKHIVVSSRRMGLTLEDFALQQQGWQRSIAMRCLNLFVATRTAASTDLLLTLPAQFIFSTGLQDQLDFAPLPIECPMPAVYLYWHERQDQDSMSMWLRSRVIHCYEFCCNLLQSGSLISPELRAEKKTSIESRDQSH